MKTWLLLFIGLFSSIVILPIDVMIAYFSTKQLRSVHYSATSGILTKSEVTIENRDDSTTYHPRIKYEYEIDGQLYFGTRYRYINNSVSDAAAAEDLKKKLAIGSRVVVYYDPIAKDDAILAPGFTEREGFALLCLIPFNAFLVPIWVAIARRYRMWGRKQEAGGLPVLRLGDEVRVRFARYSPYFYGAIAVSCGAFAIGLPGSALGSEMPTNLLMHIGLLLMILAIGGYVVLAQREKQESGTYDLIINKIAGHIQLPKSASSLELFRIPLATVSAVRIEEHEYQYSEADAKYKNMILFINPSRSVTLCDWLGHRPASP